MDQLETSLEQPRGGCRGTDEALGVKSRTVCSVLFSASGPEERATAAGTARDVPADRNRTGCLFVPVFFLEGNHLLLLTPKSVHRAHVCTRSRSMTEVANYR